MGWGTIIILAALTRIDVQLYEAAAMDGANGWKRLWQRHAARHPGHRSSCCSSCAFRASSRPVFEQIFLQRNAVGAKAGEVLDTFTYFRGIQGGDWGFSAAVGLVKGLVGTVLVFGANRAAKRVGEEGLF